MKILVIGGTYFLGRVFTLMAKNHDVTLINRGTYEMDGIRSFHFDRRDKDAWRNLEIEDYDALVDFCGYSQGDIELILDNYQGTIKHYIYISTVDVYLRGTYNIQDENHPLEYRHFKGDYGDYIYGKVLLEKELVESCQKHNIAYTSLRPGNIYGMYNYAPRESIMIKYLLENNTLYHLVDCKSQFQMVFVKDVAKAILFVLEHQCFNTAFNIVNDEIVTYDKINSIFNNVHPSTIVDKTIEEAFQDEYPLPYPLYIEEQELYSSQKIKDLGFVYTDLKEGLTQTYEAFRPVFIND